MTSKHNEILKGDDDMNTVTKKTTTGLTPTKKMILKSLIGKNDTKINFNKIREEWKNEKN